MGSGDEGYSRHTTARWFGGSGIELFVPGLLKADTPSEVAPGTAPRATHFLATAISQCASSAECANHLRYSISILAPIKEKLTLSLSCRIMSSSSLILNPVGDCAQSLAFAVAESSSCVGFCLLRQTLLYEGATGNSTRKEVPNGTDRSKEGPAPVFPSK